MIQSLLNFDDIQGDLLEGMQKNYESFIFLKSSRRFFSKFCEESAEQ
jgi:hypothetical protein